MSLHREYHRDAEADVRSRSTDAMAHLSEGEFHDEISAAPAAPGSFVDQLVEAIEEEGVRLHTAVNVARKIEELVEARGVRIAACELRRVYLCLGQMAAAECLRVAMLKDPEESIRAMAERLPVTPQAITKTVREIQRRTEQGGGCHAFSKSGKGMIGR